MVSVREAWYFRKAWVAEELVEHPVDPDQGVFVEGRYPPMEPKYYDHENRE
jgi:hypothetical protein